MFNYDHFKDSGAKRNKSKDAPVGRVCLPVLQKRFVFSPFQLNCEHNVRATVSLTPINFSKTVHVRHRKVKTHTCGIYILSVLKLALLILSAVQHSKVVRGQSVAKKRKRKSYSRDPSYRIPSAACFMCWADRNGESGFFMAYPCRGITSSG